MMLLLVVAQGVMAELRSDPVLRKALDSPRVQRALQVGWVPVPWSCLRMSCTDEVLVVRGAESHVEICSSAAVSTSVLCRFSTQLRASTGLLVLLTAHNANVMFASSWTYVQYVDYVHD